MSLFYICLKSKTNLRLADMGHIVVALLRFDIFDGGGLFKDLALGSVRSCELVDMCRSELSSRYTSVEKDFQLSVCSSITN